ncbi:hypothetical protein DUNSADRAFT_5123 [Dunaliella salina]|uniref:Encoded protein n=1 Tax=Dunaliella salina TaxID=3046 RepID=A0ABQ7H7C4_DUNSA|nr:hypothetical protein DUNSADRAFT_5123 [Dunaliella salina]|eukprot:KAF5842751.1 hypothetical protein DUNSADRAFT_5123 [Dunaliella salina]
MHVVAKGRLPTLALVPVKRKSLTKQREGYMQSCRPSALWKAWEGSFERVCQACPGK